MRPARPGKYRIVLRIIQPRLSPTTPNPSVIGLTPLSLKNLESDSELLAELRSANPGLLFDSVRKKMAFEIPADTKWTPPQGWMMNRFWFAIAEANTQLLEIPRPMGNSFSSVKPEFTVPQIQKLTSEGKRVLRFSIDQQYQVGPRMVPLVGGELCRVISENGVHCLTNHVPPLDADNPHHPPQWDCLFMVVRKVG